MGNAIFAAAALAFFILYLVDPPSPGPPSNRADSPHSGDVAVDAVAVAQICLPKYTNRQMAIYSSLARINGALLLSLKSKDGMPACSFQGKLLDALGKIPPERRDEEFAGFLDKMTHRK